MRKIIPYVIIALLVGGFYFYRYRRAPNLQFENFQIKDESGQTHFVNDQLGERTVIHFYASWCGPCLAEMRTIKDNFNELQNRGIKFIFITDDPESKINMIKESMPSEIEFYQINSLQDVGIYTIPTSYMLAGSEVKLKHTDPFDWTNQEQLYKIFQ